MKNNRDAHIKEGLSTASRQMIPEDMYGRITQSIAQEERTMNMNTTTAIPTARKKRPARWIGIAAAACILLACGVFGGNYYSHNFVIDSIVDIDVNPGIEISTNKNDVVLHVKAINSDAEKVLDGMNLKNTELKVAVNALIGSMVRNGYLIDGENSILVTVQNDDTQRATHIRNLVLSDIDASLKDNNITASVVNQTVSHSPDAREFAAAQGISFGKAAFILNLCAKDPTLDRDTLAQMDMREIAALITETGIDIRDIVDYDAADSIWENIQDAVEDANEDDKASQANTAISAEKAKEIALSHASVSAANASFVRAELDSDGGAMVYDIEFTAGGMEYDYEINAQTGAIISSEKEAADAPAGGSNYTGSAGSTQTGIPADTAQSNEITLDDAKQLALAYVGISSSDVVYEKAKLDMDDGVQVYDIEFVSGTTEYDFEIHAQTGEIISVSKEAVEDATPGASAPAAETSPQASVITAAQAKEIALNHAGVSAASATFFKVELDYDDGVQVYEVEFCVGVTEYDYEISASTGSVIHYESEIDD